RTPSARQGCTSGHDHDPASGRTAPSRRARAGGRNHPPSCPTPPLRSPAMTTVSTPTGPQTPALAVAPRRRPRNRHRPVWQEQPSLPGAVAKGLVLTLICLAVLFPLYTVVLTSISTQATITEAGGLVTVPGEITLAAY